MNSFQCRSPEVIREQHIQQQKIKSRNLFRNSYQQGFFSIFSASGSNPLSLWDTNICNGSIKRYLDPELRQLVLEISGSNVSTTYMTCPRNNDTLGIVMPFLVMIVKNLKKYFTFEITIRDMSSYKRRFRISNFQSSTQIYQQATAMPISLADGWNQIQFNLVEFTRKAYREDFFEVVSLKVNANIILKHIYFATALVPDEELPRQYRLFYPLSKKHMESRKSREVEGAPEGRLSKTGARSGSRLPSKTDSQLRQSAQAMMPQPEIPPDVFLVPEPPVEMKYQPERIEEGDEGAEDEMVGEEGELVSEVGEYEETGEGGEGRRGEEVGEDGVVGEGREGEEVGEGGVAGVGGEGGEAGEGGEGGVGGEGAEGIESGAGGVSEENEGPEGGVAEEVREREEVDQ